MSSTLTPHGTDMNLSSSSLLHVTKNVSRLRRPRRRRQGNTASGLSKATSPLPHWLPALARFNIRVRKISTGTLDGIYVRILYRHQVEQEVGVNLRLLARLPSNHPLEISSGRSLNLTLTTVKQLPKLNIPCTRSSVHHHARENNYWDETRPSI